MSRFLITYLILALIGLVVLNLNAAQIFIDAFCLGLANLSWGIIQIFDSGITLSGAILRYGDSGFALKVTNACSALPISWLLCVAVLSFPAPWRMKLWVVPAAFLLIQSINTLRVISLVYFGEWFSRPMFDVIHESIWPVMLILIAILAFVAWILYVKPHAMRQNVTA